MKSEMLMYLQQAIGEKANAEKFERVINLLENSTLSVQVDIVNLGKNGLENIILSFMERLEIALEQIDKLPSVLRIEESKTSTEREKYLNLITDLLKLEMITPQEYEISLKNPDESSLPWLLNSLRNEARELFSILVIGYPERKQFVEENEIKDLLTTAIKKVLKVA